MASYILYVVRHGEMFMNRPENYDKIIKFNLDGSLTEKGIAEVEILGKAIADEQFTRCYSSDFVRAKQTADYILKHSNKPTPEIIIEKKVRERDCGIWGEKTPMDMIKEAMRLQVYPHCMYFEGGETWEQLIERAGEFFKSICKEVDENTEETKVLVTTHGGWMASLMEYLILSKNEYLLEDCDEKFARQPAPTTGVIRLLIEKNSSEGNGKRKIKFLSIHDQSHLKNQSLPE